MMRPSKDRGREPLSTRWKRMTEEEKRRRIVDAVLQVIAKHGVQATTTARIAAAAGVSEPTIYRTFRSRKEMLLAAADRVWQQRHDELESFEATDAMDHLRKICELHTVGIQRTRVVRYITELAVAPASDGLREHLREQQLREAQRFAAIVEEGKAQGCIRADVDSEETAWRIMAVHWLEAMARLHGLEDQVLTGFSTRRFESILEEIAVDPAAARCAAAAAREAAPATEPVSAGAGAGPT
jgi:AcrR family transcriptional regulator